MIIYRKPAFEFLHDVDNNMIVELIQRAFVKQMGWSPPREVGAWTTSLKFMESAVRKAKLSDDCGILIEYKIPPTSNRIDFIVAGEDDEGRKNFVIVELKQWDSAIATQMDGVVITILNRAPRETAHPSYQAFSYKTLLLDYNENVEKKNLKLHSCAYLHNYKEGTPEPLRSKIYQTVIADSPLFFKHDPEKLQQFLTKLVGRGKGMEILYEIEAGRIRPSKKLIEHVCSMFEGNHNFTLIDNQKVAYEKAIDLARKAGKKTVVIIKGGPGTGKSVISVSLLGALLKEEQNVVFVAPNASFRDVMLDRLARENTKVRLKSLFRGSSSFTDLKPNTYDVIVVDEAHRLKDGSAYQYRGDNQVEDIVKAGHTIICFVDDDQRIRPEDIGSVNEIRRVAKLYKAEIHEFELDAQYRCAGAEGFVNWLDNLFQLKETPNYSGWDSKDFEFRIFDNPKVLHMAIREKNRNGFAARMLAGYAWKWTSEDDGNSDGEVEDVTIPEFGFNMPWNSRRSRTTWAIDPEGVDQVGCIHTSQGLEFDYVGVIIGPDLSFDISGRSFDVSWVDYKDNAGKKGLKNNPKALNKLVRNIYKTLMSRAMKGCYVYVCDSGLREHFKKSASLIESKPAREVKPSSHGVLDLIEAFVDEHLKYKTHLPVYSIAAACGRFANGESTEPEGWIRIVGSERLNKNMFVVRALGKSMEPNIPDGSYCVFRQPVIGTRNNKIVLVQHYEVSDPDYGGAYTIKKYTSRKTYREDGAWEHEAIELKSLNPDYAPIALPLEKGTEFTVIAEFIKTL
jgi:DUF2075 family protein/phage repressor protein C with HTH and peptisase S24 domain